MLNPRKRRNQHEGQEEGGRDRRQQGAIIGSPLGGRAGCRQNHGDPKADLYPNRVIRTHLATLPCPISRKWIRRAKTKRQEAKAVGRANPGTTDGASHFVAAGGSQPEHTANHRHSGVGREGPFGTNQAEHVAGKVGRARVQHTADADVRRHRGSGPAVSKAASQQTVAWRLSRFFCYPDFQM